MTGNRPQRRDFCYRKLSVIRSICQHTGAVCDEIETLSVKVVFLEERHPLTPAPAISQTFLTPNSFQLETVENPFQ